jgi:hypothetical protein
VVEEDGPLESVSGFAFVQIKLRRPARLRLTPKSNRRLLLPIYLMVPKQWTMPKHCIEAPHNLLAWPRPLIALLQ